MPKAKPKRLKLQEVLDRVPHFWAEARVHWPRGPINTSVPDGKGSLIKIEQQWVRNRRGGTVMKTDFFEIPEPTYNYTY